MRINVTAISIKIAIDKAVCEQLEILVFIVMYGACVTLPYQKLEMKKLKFHKKEMLFL